MTDQKRAALYFVQMSTDGEWHIQSSAWLCNSQM